MDDHSTQQELLEALNIKFNIREVWCIPPLPSPSKPDSLLSCWVSELE